jgi:hypothetical protein
MVSNVRVGIGISLLVGLTLSLLLWVSASPAQAEPVEDCQAEIAQVRSLLTDRYNPDYVDSFTNAKDRTGLVGKLDSASTKLSRGKTDDALVNLTSFRDKVSDLAAQDKLDDADAEVLNSEINDAITCVEALQAPAPTAA